jgi:hypothetical protein
MWACTHKESELADGHASIGWTDAWHYLDSDYQPSRSESSTYYTSACNSQKLLNKIKVRN